MADFDAADWFYPDVGSGWLLDVNASSTLGEALLSALTADSAAFGRPTIVSSALGVAPDRRFIGNARVGNGAGVLSSPIPSTTVNQWTLFASFSLGFTNVEKAAAGVGGGSSSPLLSLHHVANSAKMRVWARNDSGSNPAATVYTSADVFDGLPHDVALIFDGTTLRSVVDGVEDATCAWTAGNFTINRHAICGSWRNGAAYNPSVASAYRSLFFDKALSVAEVRELASQDAGGLFSDPLRGVYMPYWAGAGGVTQVTSDLTAIYDIRAAASSDLSAAYAVRGAVAGDLSASYDIRTYVAQDLAASYVVRGAVVSDLDSIYPILGAVSADMQANYAIRGAVSADLEAIYEIQGAGTVSADLICSYAIRGSAVSDLTASYPLRGAVGSDLAASYDIRAAVSSDLTASYAVDGALISVYADLTASYMIEGVADAGPTAAEIAAAVIAAAQATPIWADTRKMNGANVLGNGTSGDKWRG